MSATIEKIKEILEEPINSIGYQLWGIELTSGRNSTLRVFIDKDNGINIDDCVAVNNIVSAILDVEDPISQNYLLEVSSPGLDRPLFTIEQYSLYVGHEVSISLRIPQENRKKYRGVIKSVDNNNITLEFEVKKNEVKQITVAFTNIQKGNYEPKF